jgi:hypothetical protein
MVYGSLWLLRIHRHLWKGRIPDRSCEGGIVKSQGITRIWEVHIIYLGWSDRPAEGRLARVGGTGWAPLPDQGALRELLDMCRGRVTKGLVRPPS